MSEASKPHSRLRSLIVECRFRYETTPSVPVLALCDEAERLIEQLEAANERLSQYEEPGWINPVQKVQELKEQLEALQRALDEEQARRYHYQAHGKPGVQSFSDCEANECVDARASLASYPASSPTLTEAARGSGLTSGNATTDPQPPLSERDTFPATEPLSAYCNWGTVCRLPVGHAGPHEYPAKERP